MHPSLDGPTRMYGLSILEYHVKNAWDEGNGGGEVKKSGGGGFGASPSGFGPQKTSEGLLLLTPKQKVSLQTSILNMISMGLNDALDEEVYLKEKICVVLAEIAKRSWPLEWPNLMKDLVGAKTQAEAKVNGSITPASVSLPPGVRCIAEIGISQLEIVVTFFRVLAEEIGSPISDVPNSRKKMMINALHHLSEEHLFSQILFQHLDTQLCIYSQAKEGYVDEQLVEMLPGGRVGPGARRSEFLAQVGQSDLLTNPAHIALHQSILAVNAILHSLIAFAEWMKLENFINCPPGGPNNNNNNHSGNNAPHKNNHFGSHNTFNQGYQPSVGPTLTHLMIVCIGEAPFRVRAAELLLVMVSRPRPERDAMLFLFNHLPEMAAAMESVPADLVMAEVESRGGASSSAPALAFSRRLAQTLCLLGQIYLDFLNINRPPPHLDLFMSGMLNIASHPSLQLSALAAAFWKRFLSQPIFQQQPYFISTCETLLGNMQWAFVKWQFFTEGTDPASGIAVCPPLLHQFRMVDFEDDEETYIHFQAEHRSTLTRSIIAPIAQIIPATAIAFIRFQWGECTKIFSSLVPFTEAAAAEDGGAVVSSPQVDPKSILSPDILSALTSLFESVCHLTSVINEYISPASMGIPLPPGPVAPEIQALFSRTRSHKAAAKSAASGAPSKKANKKAGGKNTSGAQDDDGPLQNDAEAHQLIYDSSGEILQSLISFNSAVDEISAVQIDACKSFLSFFYANPESLEALLTRLMSLVTYTGLDPYVQQRIQQAQAAFDAGDAATCLAEMASILSAFSAAPSGPCLAKSNIILRRKACTALISIGKSIPSALIGKISDIMKAMGEWMSRGLLNSSEIILLMDWVASLSNAMEPADQEVFLKNLIIAQVEGWQSTFVTEATASPRALLAFAGALPRHSQRQRKMLNANASLLPSDPSLYSDLPPNLIPASPAVAHEQRSSLTTLLDSLCAVWRRVSNLSSRRSSSQPTKTPLEAYYETDSNALSPLDLALLPNLLRLIACIHQMWSVEIKEHFDESCKGAYELNEHLVSTWLRSTATAKAHDEFAGGMAGLEMGDGWDDGSGGSVEETEQSVWNRFFSATRLQAYTLLGSIIQHQSPFWMDSPELLNSFAGAVLVNLDQMHPYDLSLLLKRVILPAIQMCPPHAYDHLQDILKVILPCAGELVTKLYKSKAEKEKANAAAVASAAQASRSNLPAQLNYDDFSTQSSHPEMGTNEEIILDRSVVELLNTVAIVIQSCVLRSKGGNSYVPGSEDTQEAQQSPFLTNGFSPFPAASAASASWSNPKSTYTYPFSNFFVHLLRTGNGATHWLLSCVNSIFSWAENHSTRRMCNVLTQIISGTQEAAEERMFAIGPLAASSGGGSNHNSNKRGGGGGGGGGMAGVSMATMSSSGNVNAEAEARLAAALEANPYLPPDDPSTPNFLVPHSFQAVLYALHQQSENAGMLITLARELYSLNPNAANTTLLEIPNITHAAITKFTTDLSHQSTQKGKSGVMRELLEKVAGWDLTPAAHSATHTTRILDVPAPLFALHVAKRQQAAKEKQALDDQAQLGLATIFT